MGQTFPKAQAGFRFISNSSFGKAAASKNNKKTFIPE